MAQETEGKKPEADPGQKEGMHPRKWWQWVLVYPGLAVAVLGAVPTYTQVVKSFLFDVPIKRTFDAEEQTRLWQKNFDCAQNASFTTITNEHQVEIGSTVCKSGDVLLRSKRPEWHQHKFRWLSLDTVAPGTAKKKSSTLFNIFSEAYADETKCMLASNGSSSVICQRWIGNGRLLQRIRTSTGCVDQVINTFNGWVISSTPAPCTPNC